jgi:serine/threonine protein kinase/tetratricopeptide (TPR) repeat protein
MSGTNLDRSEWAHEPTLRRFEDAWRDGQSPQIDDFLPAIDDDHTGVLVELVCTDLEYRLKAGHPARVEEYRDRFPQLASDPAALLDMIEVEFGTRRHAEPALSPSEYVQRFPHLRDRLSGRLAIAPTLKTGMPASRTTRVPTIPGYEILDELGRGGMGIVYQARQVGLNRLVALKMILDTRTDEAALARFRAEAAAVAALQHPNIVQVYEVGEAGGRPYFSLEFVPGGSLTAALAGTPQPARAVAAMVEPLARAVQYAHEKGIVHRDLKPANILLSFAHSSLAVAKTQTSLSEQQTIDKAPWNVDHGPPKISDFGLAKWVEGKSGLTHTGDVVGTPSYMAPEQAAGRTNEVGPLADVYALGAILYECLTGRPPFKGATAVETLHQVVTVEPVPPTRLQPSVPADIETICLKCLAKEPQRRYASAEALADDLGRFYRGEPIVARPVGTVERLWRWAKRNPRIAGLTAALLLVLTSGLATVTGLWWLADARRAQAEVARRDADAQRRVADDNWQLGREAVRAFTRVADDPLFRAEGMQPAQELVVRTALQHFKTFIERRGDDPGARLEVAEAQVRAARLTNLLGDKDAALIGYIAAERLLRPLLDGPDGPAVRLTLAACCREIGDLRLATGQPIAEALAAVREGVALAEALPATDSEARQELARGYAARGEFERTTGDVRQAAASFEQALAVATTILGDRPSADVRALLAKVYYDLAQIDLQLGQTEPAGVRLEQARDAFTALAAAHPAVAEFRRNLSACHLYLGRLKLQANDTVGCMREYDESRRLMAAVVERNPAVAAYRLDLARVLVNIGLFHQLADRRQDEAAVAREAMTLVADLRGRFPRDVASVQLLAQVLNFLGVHHRRFGRIDDARASYEDAARVWKQLAAANPTVVEFRQSLGRVYNNLALLEAAAGHPDRRLELLQQVRTIRQELADRNPEDPQLRRDVGGILVNIGVAHHEAKKYEPALAALHEATTVFADLAAKHSDPEYSHLLTMCRFAMANSLSKAGGHASETEFAYRSVLADIEKLPTSGPYTATSRLVRISCLAGLGELMWREKRSADALTWLDQSRAAGRAAVAANPDLHEAHDRLAYPCGVAAAVYWATGRKDDAIAARQEQAAALRRVFETAGRPASARRSLSNVLADLTRELRATERLDEAVAAALDRRALWPKDGPELFKVATDLAACLRPTDAGDRVADLVAETLRQTAAAGFTDWKKLDSDAAFGVYRGRPEYEAVSRDVKNRTDRR